MKNENARRLAAMLTDQQRRDVLQLARAISDPAGQTPPADVPNSDTGDFAPVRG